MTRGRHTRSIALLATALLCSGLLAGCAGGGESVKDTVPGNFSEVPLSTAKGLTQLLLNDLVGRVDSSQLGSLTDQSNASESCLSDVADPGGTIRRWETKAQVVFVHPDYSQQIADEITRSYTDLGWVLDAPTNGSNAAVLTSPDSPATLHIEANGTGILFDVEGPCGRTEGRDSAEVKALEGRS